MNTLYKFIATIATVSIISAVSAQNEKKDSALHQSMTIERNFSPIVRDHNKIDQQPTVPEIKVQKSQTEYSDWMAGEAVSGEIGRMKAGQVIAEPNPYKNGFVELSAGNYFNADMKVGINVNEEFSIDIDGFFTKGDLDIPNDEYIYPEIINDGNIDGKQQLISRPELWESRFLNGNIKINYNHLLTNSGRIRAYVLAGGRNYNMLRFVEESQQKLGRIWALTNYEKDNWFVEILGKHTGIDLPDIADNCVNIKGGYGIYYNEDWQLKLALDLGIEFGENQPLTFYPELEYSHFGNNSLSRFYIKAAGGIVKPDLYEIMTVMPLALPGEYKTEKELLNITIGYENNDNGNMKWGVYAGTKYTYDRMDGFMSNWLIFPSDIETGKEIYARLGHIYHGELSRSDEFELKVGGYFDYRINRLFEMKCATDLNSNPRFGAPKFTANIHFIANPSEKISLDLGIDSGMKREMYYRFPIDVNENIDYSDTLDLGNIFDLNLRANYQFKDNLSIFLFGKNFLNQEYQLWAGVPAQKINIHAGFNWRF